MLIIMFNFDVSLTLACGFFSRVVRDRGHPDRSESLPTQEGGGRESTITQHLNQIGGKTV